MTVDEFVDTRVLPEFRETVEAIQRTLRELTPEAQEVISYGIPSYRVKQIVAVISPTKKDITLSFTKGAEFEDKYGLLHGVGHVSRHIKFKRAAGVDKEILTYYVRHQNLWGDLFFTGLMEVLTYRQTSI